MARRGWVYDSFIIIRTSHLAERAARHVDVRLDVVARLVERERDDAVLELLGVAVVVRALGPDRLHRRRARISSPRVIVIIIIIIIVIIIIVGSIETHQKNEIREGER